MIRPVDTAAAGRTNDQLRSRLEPVAHVGYAVSGVLHLLIGYLAVRVALGQSGGSADQSGALAQIAGTPGGSVVLWVATVALAALGLWQLTDAVARGRSPGGEAKDVAKAVGKGVVYLALAFTTLSFARGGGSSSEQQTTDLTAQMVQSGPGRVLVAVIGLALLGVGGYHVVKGVQDRFLRDLGALPRSGAKAALWSGRIGYPAKGVALGVLGVLFVLAAVQADPQEAGGLDTALRTLAEAPFGAVLLVLVGLGFAVFGVYSFFRARYGRL